MTIVDTPTEPRRGLADALAELQTQLPHIAKDLKVNAGPMKYSYADLAQITRELLPIMGKLGLSFISKPTLNANGQFVLAYRLLHISGESDGGEYPLPSGGTPQATGSAITYARRYSLCAITGVAPDNDDDAAAAEKATTRRSRRDQPPADDDAPAAITAKQQRDMQDLFKKLAVGDREDKLQFAAGVVKRPADRPLRSAAELSRAEADQVIAALTADAADLNPTVEEAA